MIIYYYYMDTDVDKWSMILREPPKLVEWYENCIEIEVNSCFEFFEFVDMYDIELGDLQEHGVVKSIIEELPPG